MTLKFSGFRAVVEISSSCVQRFMSYRANREKNSDENNTVRRYRADSNNTDKRAFKSCCCKTYEIARHALADKVQS